jgi:hypothetical protein
MPGEPAAFMSDVSGALHNGGGGTAEGTGKE